MDDSASRRCLVTLCTYRERENVSTLIPAIRHAFPSADILVVDDNSPDGTADVVRELANRDPQIQLLSRQEKTGLGAATIAGFQWGLERSYDVVINLDADWSHPPERLPDLLAALDRAEVAICSRYIAGGKIRGWPWQRHWMSWGINGYSRFLLGLTPRDCSGAYRAYRSELLRKLDFDRFRSQGYAFQEELLFRCRLAGARFVEVPFTFVERQAGHSKLSVVEILRALWDIFVLGIRRGLGLSV